MSTKGLAPPRCEEDSLWRRLYFTLPAALCAWIGVLWAFAYFVGHPADRLPEPTAVEAQLVEIPPPPPPPRPEPKKPAPVREKPVVAQRPPPVPAVATPHVKVEESPAPVREEKPAVVPVTPPEPPTPAPKAAPEADLAGTGGAQAIFRPMPRIPDELREDALSTSAVARFQVAVDGSVSVELVKPTPNPRLNRLLLDTLKNWKFFPAMKNGKPVASTQEIVVKIDVK